jgi:hypothetical protein
MASLGMQGPYPLSTAEIDRQITRTSAGNYALTRSTEGTFYVNYVGRSDNNLNGRLKDHVGSKYSRFMFSPAASPKAAFEKECHNYHDFGGSEKLDNERHPDRPGGTDWKCPRCQIFG